MSSMYGCLSPVRIRNRYTGDIIWSRCRKCEYCLSLRANELAGRVKREQEDPRNGTSFFVTLTYDNENIPLYIYNPETATWHSNRYSEIGSRSRYGALDDCDVPQYYAPIGGSPDTFAHLCREDVQDWLHFSRIDFRNLFRLSRRRLLKLDKLCDILATYERGEKVSQFWTKKYKSGALQQQIADIENEEFYNLFYRYGFEEKNLRFRYFVCGEYGPSTYRPHYHVVLWFRERFSGAQKDYLQRLLSARWSYGDIDIQEITTTGVQDYVASYVTGYSGLPGVLQTKSLRPFSLCSSTPMLGTVDIDLPEILEILIRGSHGRTKWNPDTSDFEPEYLPPSFYRRYFPKCSGYSYRDPGSRISVYSYVFNYFRDRGVTHTVDEVKNLRFRDIEFPLRPFLDDFGRLSWAPWDYRDRYASLVCYKYCIAFGWSPEAVVAGFDLVYCTQELEALRNQMIGDELHNVNYSLSPFDLNRDPEFVYNIPYFMHDLTEFVYSILVEHNCDIDLMYIDGVLSGDYFESAIIYRSDGRYIEHKANCEARILSAMKSKKSNEYKKKLSSNLIINKL